MNRSQSGLSSSLLSTKDMFSGELSSNTNKTGVGVLFQLDADGRVIVKTIVGGGAADRTRGTGPARPNPPHSSFPPPAPIPPHANSSAFKKVVHLPNISVFRAGSHEIRVGDFITRVDSRDVEREPMTVLKELILGPQGTQVRPPALQLE
jgi:hypothetical protein